MPSPPPRPDAVTLAAVSAGGALGAAARYAVTQAWPPDGFGWATVVVNASGCLLIGVLMGGVVEAGRGHRLLRPFLGVGVLGGYTTFSAYAVQGEGLLSAHPSTALAYLALTPVVAVLATAAGALAARRVRDGVTWLWLCLGAALGAPARYLVDVAARRRTGSDLPLGTLLVNVAGSFLLGLVVGAGPPAAVVAGVGAGFCGALTTYSTFGYETLRLAEAGRARAAAANVLISVALGLAAAALGHSLGEAL